MVEIDREEALRLERAGALRLVPSKGVHTLKPPGSPGSEDVKYKRKYRLVLCGNFVAPEEQFGSLCAGGASAETFRTVLASTAHKGWWGATADITGAFLLAHWPEHLHRYAVVPPRILIDNHYVPENTFWLVLRPLYGLRESPAIWAAHRSARFSSARIRYENKYLVLKMSKVDPELWFVFFEGEDELLGCIITYVDDLFYVARTEVVMVLHAWVLEEWPCSGLEWASADGGTRYLGMEIFQRPSGAYEVHQRGYILDLLRSHDMLNAPGTLLPCPKEWVSDDISPEPETFSEAELRLGQRMVGEQLWLTMRSRPDLQFVVGHMAQWVSRHPRRVARVAKRVLAYLVSTLNLKLVLGGQQQDSSIASASSTRHAAASGVSSEVVLVGYSDSSFAPYGERSYGASVVTVNSSPVAWKSGRQGMITLSTMESELMEAINAAVLLESVGCLLDEMYGRRLDRVLRVDNMSATSMLQGGAGSWRTRHLKVRSGYLREQVAAGLLEVHHTEGVKQLADLATKMHPRARLLDLLAQWSFEGLPPEDVCAQLAKVVAFHCIVVALERLPVASASQKDPIKEPLASAGVDELLLVSGLVAVVAILVWEFLKWLFRCMRRSVRKESKLRRLRELARLTAELEIDRLQQEHQVPSSTEIHQAVQAAFRSSPEVSPRHEGTTRTRQAPVTPPRTRHPEPDRRSFQGESSTASSQVPATPPRASHLEAQDEGLLRCSPGGISTTPSVDDDVLRHYSRERLCKDMLSLITCENLKHGLRQERMTVSGHKPELVARLVMRLLPDPCFAVEGRELPTERQMKYVLWLWKHKGLQCKCNLKWSDVATKSAISSWIHAWKEA